MIIDDPFGATRYGGVAELALAPVASAPVKAGKVFGPCLLGPGSDGEWIIGHWDGNGWYRDDGSAVSPIYWALLPPIKELIASIEPASLGDAIAILDQLRKDEDQLYPEAIENVVAFLRELAKGRALNCAE